MSNTFVIKLGGSMVSPSKETIIDYAYVARLKQALLPQIQAGEKFFITVGGGHLSRMYVELAKEAGIEATEDLHWIGTTACVMNAELVRAYLADLADPGIYKYEDYYNSDALVINKNLKVGGGGRAGHSSDTDILRAALKLRVKTVYSLKNIDGVYSADPKLDSNAKRIDRLTWKEYLDVIGNLTEHTPGGNFPIDPIASRLAQENGIQFYILSGVDLGNFAKALEGGEFIGTIVK